MASRYALLGSESVDISAGIRDQGSGIKKIPARLLVLPIAALLYLAPLLLDAPLTDPDEGLHAAISQEMVERGDFIVPRFLGRPFLDKPILFFWAQAASMRAFGMTTAAARLPGVLFALLGIVTTGWLAGMLFSGRQAAGSGQWAVGSRQQVAGGAPGSELRAARNEQHETASCQLPAASWLAAGCYATMVLPFLLAQAPVHDIALVPLTNLALGFLWRAGRDAGSGIRCWPPSRWDFRFSRKGSKA